MAQTKPADEGDRRFLPLPPLNLGGGRTYGAARDRGRPTMHTSDVLVIGKGNAALCAALAARDQGASVTMLEAASEEESGGNSAFAGGVMRFAFDGVEDLARVAELSPKEIASSEFGTNTRDEYFDDLFRLTSYRTDPELSELLVTRSLDAMVWLRAKGVRFVPNFGRESPRVNGEGRFFGRLPIEVPGGGAGNFDRQSPKEPALTVHQ